MVLLVLEICLQGLSLSDLVSSFILIAFFVPLGNAILMQLTGHSLLRRIARREWRESLWLTEIKSRPYLISQLKSRANLQGIPFAAGILCCIFAAVGGLITLSQQPESERSISFIFGGALIYALLSMQFCGLCAGFLGHLNRLRSLCRHTASELASVLIALKWIAIIIIPFANLFLGLFIADSIGAAYFKPADPEDVFLSGGRVLETVFSLYTLFVCTLLNLFFYRRLSASWKKAQVEFFTFE